MSERDRSVTYTEVPGGEARTPLTLMAGAVLAGRYEIRAHIGEGGMGQVLRAVDRMLGEEVALKLLRPEHSGSKQWIERLARELKLARQIRHVNVCRIFELGNADGHWFITMELAEGGTLRQLLDTNPPRSFAERLADARAVVDGLAAIHAVGIVHRDVTPRNVLRMTDGRLVVSDLGLALHHDQTTTSFIAGTPAYISPELYKGAKPAPSSDVWQLGVVMHEILFGARPQWESTRPGSPPVSPLGHHSSDLEKQMAELCLACVADDPAARPADAGEVARRMTAPASAPRTAGVRPRAARTLRRWWWAVIPVVGVAAISLMLGVWRGRPTAPASERRVGIVVHNQGAPAEDRLNAAIEHLARWKLRELDRRIRVVDVRASADLVVTIRHRRHEGFSLEAGIGPSGGPTQPAGSFRASSVGESLDGILRPLAKRLALGLDTAGPGPGAQEQSARLGTRNVEAYEMYLRSEEMWRAIHHDVEEVGRRLDSAIRLDPGWAHPYGPLVLNQGLNTDAAGATLRLARTQVQRRRDPAGDALLDALEHLRARRPEKVVELLDPVFRKNPTDIMLGFVLFIGLNRLNLADDAIAVIRRLHDQRPDLQFGSDLIAALDGAGRGDETETVVRAWLERAPDSEQARAANIALDVEAGRFDAALQQAQDIILLHGEQPHRLARWCDALILSGRLQEARAIADRMIQGPEPYRARGRYRHGVIAILEGRFASAYESLALALSESRTSGLISDMTQTLESLRTLAPLVGHKDKSMRYTEDLADTLGRFGMKALEAASRFAAALEREKPACPTLAEFVKVLPIGPAQNAARREMLRAGAAAGCATCQQVVHAGLSPEEKSPRSLLLFGICAERVGQLPLAADALQRALRVRLSAIDARSGLSSPYHSIVAKYHLARVRERLGDTAEARRLYSEFVARWGSSDRPLREVEKARFALASLEKPIEQRTPP